MGHRMGDSCKDLVGDETVAVVVEADLVGNRKMEVVVRS